MTFKILKNKNSFNAAWQEVAETSQRIKPSNNEAVFPEGSLDRCDQNFIWFPFLNTVVMWCSVPPLPAQCFSFFVE
jgi:hypothetical protein